MAILKAAFHGHHYLWVQNFNLRQSLPWVFVDNQIDNVVDGIDDVNGDRLGGPDMDEGSSIGSNKHEEEDENG